MCGVRSPATVDLILETLLRAKGNTIILGTTPYPDERSLKLAARRGVVVTASHFEILGFNAFAWSRAYGGESRQLWDWRKHPDLMAATWRAAIEAQKDYETIWSLGLRGLNDYAYPGCEGPADCGAVISEAVANQTQLLQEVLGKDVSELDFKFNLWVEALGMYGPLSYRTAARTLFDRPFLARFCSFFRRFFAVLSGLTPGFQNVAPKDRGPAA